MKIFNLIVATACLVTSSTYGIAPANDNCSNAVSLTVGSTCVLGTNVDATIEADSIDTDTCYTGQEWVSSGGSNAPNAPNATVWYQFTTGSAGSYTISTDNGGTTDTQMKLLVGTCGNWTSVICDDNGGTCLDEAAEITASLAANVTYYVMIDVLGSAVGPFCISVVDNNETTTNDCINNAIDINALTTSISTNTPFVCNLYDYKNVKQDLIEYYFTLYTGCHNPLGVGIEEVYFGTWFKFTHDSNNKSAWLSVHPANTLACDDSEDIFYTLHLFEVDDLDDTESGNCNGELITGLIPIDCSAGDGKNANGGARDKAAGSFKDHPRLDISNLQDGAEYYVMVAELTRFEVGIVMDTIVIFRPTTGEPDTLYVPREANLAAAPSNGQFYLTLEAAPASNISCDGVSSDVFSYASDITNTNYSDLTNAGMQGNIWAGNGGTAYSNPIPDEPLKYQGVNTIGGSDQNCSGTAITGRVLDSLNNNSAIYSFEVQNNASVVEITLSNIAVCGIDGAETIGQLMTVLDANGALVCWGRVDETTNSLCLRVCAMPAGEYYVVIDGQGSVMSYDLSVDVLAPLTTCTLQAMAPMVNRNPLVLEGGLLADFNSIAVQPIPASSELQVSYTLVEASDVMYTIRVFDMMGKEVISTHTLYAQNGINTHLLDVSDLNAGLYILSVEKGNERLQTRFMKVD